MAEFKKAVVFDKASITPGHGRAFLNAQAEADEVHGLVTVQVGKVTISYHADGMIVARDSGEGTNKAWHNRAAFADEVI